MKENEKAFPRPQVGAGDRGNTRDQEGMELRDYFASKAFPEKMPETDNDGIYDYDRLAKMKYLLADAMIRNR
ncbi:MAG: hypothetical protein GY793_05275 [Proteobacteria bacterium]|nr:hypothetical protein [Pseudomonadota bacterium]